MRTRKPDEFAQLISTLRDFIQTEVIPREDWGRVDDASNAQLVAELRTRAAALGLGPPLASREEGGLELLWEESAEVLEAVGRSYLGPMVLQCEPPIQPDLYALDKLASPEQRAKYVLPLRAGQKKSCFAMTEPAPGAGSDPRMLRTTATRTADGWVINGHKWFITGARQADFAIVLAMTDKGVSWFLVDKDTPGFGLVRDIATIEPFDMGGHGEIMLDDCRVGHDALIAEEGRGLDYAQLRLEGARLFHCMRFIGLASRAMDFAQDYVKTRTSYGKPLAEHQMVQGLIADTHIQLYAARMMTRDVACRLDEGRSIRHHSSMAKVFVSEAVYQAADSAVQICGALGVSEDAPLSMILRMLRPFRIYDGASEVHRAAIARRALYKDLSA